MNGLLKKAATILQKRWIFITIAMKIIPICMSMHSGQEARVFLPTSSRNPSQTRFARQQEVWLKWFVNIDQITGNMNRIDPFNEHWRAYLQHEFEVRYAIAQMIRCMGVRILY